MTPLNTIIEEEKKEFIEKGADIEHERWSKWQAYLHSKCVEHSDGKGEWVCFPSELFKRWERQINTPYSELSEAEKESDREQVRSYDALLTSAMQRAAKAERIDWLRSEIEKLEGEMKDNVFVPDHNPSPYGGLICRECKMQEDCDCHVYNEALTSIITRYKEELKVLETHNEPR